MKIKNFLCGILAAAAAFFAVSCSDISNSSGGNIDPDGKYGDLTVNTSDRAFDSSSITSATVKVYGYGMDAVGPVTVSLSGGKTSSAVTIKGIPVGKNRVVVVEGTTCGNTLKMYGYGDINAYTDGTVNSISVNWETSKVGGTFLSMLNSNEDITQYTPSSVKTIVDNAVSGVHGSCINYDKMKDCVKAGETVLGAYLATSRVVKFTGNQAASDAVVSINDPSSSSITGITGSEQSIKDVTPGDWTFTITNNGKTYTQSIRVEAVSGPVTASSTAELNLGTVSVPGVSSSVSEKSAVMLQGFTWNSAPRGTGWNKENPSPYWYRWYGIMKNRADDIKNTFGYVWFNPPSICDSSSSEGYAPTQLNDLNSYYGTADELKAVISAIAPAKAIADIVVNHRAGTTCWGDFTNPDWGVVKGSNYTAICSDDEAFDSTSGDTAHMVGKPSGAADTGASYGAYRDLDHTNPTVQNGIISWMNDVLKPAGFVGWRYDYVKGFAGKYVGQYNKGSSAEFSVGEYWPTAGYSSSSPSSWGDEIKSWVSATESGGQRSRAFDFALKGAMNDVFGCTWNGGGSSATNNYGLLADRSNLYISQPSDAVTFVDNHDTGSNQGHWALNQSSIGVAYALILTHPGVPCVAWSHYFTFAEGGNGNTTYPYSSISAEGTYLGGTTVAGTSNTLRQHIDYLIKLRKDMGIEYDSERETKKADGSGYAAEITGLNGSVIVLIGSGYTPDDSDYEKVYSGTNFCIWTKSGSGTTKCKTPVITISDGKASITCGTSNAVIKYGFSSSAMTNTYSSAVTMTEGQTIYAYASCSGMEDSSTASKTYTAGKSLTITADSWTWNSADVFAWAWKTGSTGSWVKCSGSGSTVNVTVDADCTYFLLVRCPAGTTTPSWTATGDTAGRIYNKTDDVSITSSSSYTVNFTDYSPS